jgi:hypothetical protein
MQSASSQRLGKHVPTCSNGRCVSEDECLYLVSRQHSAPIYWRNNSHMAFVFYVVCDTQQSKCVSALSVPRLYNMSPLAAKESFSEFRGSREIENEMARRFHSDLK